MTDTFYHSAANIATHLMDQITANKLLDKTAVIYERPDYKLTLTYRELFDHIERFAASLKENGLQKGEHIFIRLTNSPEVIVAFLGAMQAGVIPAIMSTHIGNGDIAEYVKETESKLLFSVLKDEPELPGSCKHYSLINDLGKLNFGGFISDAHHQDKISTSKDALAFITYTSGITNRSKAILHAHRFLEGIINLRDEFKDCSSDSKMAFIGDLGWSFGIYQGILLPLLVGSTIYIYYDNGGFKPETWWNKLYENNIDILYATPTVYRMMTLVTNNHKINLRRCMAVGETLPAETWKNWHDNYGIDIIQSYGQAETGILAMDYNLENKTPGKSGKILSNIKHMIIDDEGKEAPDGHAGHLLIARDYPSVMLKYLVPAEKNDEVFRGDWYITGDIVMQHDGVLTYLGRKENILKYKGSKISVVEIESIYRQFEDAQEAAVIECPDIELGQILKVFIKLRADVKPSDDMAKQIQVFVAGKLSENDLPKKIEFIAEMPKTKSGKTRREALRQKEMDKFLKNQAV